MRMLAVRCFLYIVLIRFFTDWKIGLALHCGSSWTMSGQLSSCIIFQFCLPVILSTKAWGVLIWFKLFRPEHDCFYIFVTFTVDANHVFCCSQIFFPLNGPPSTRLIQQTLKIPAVSGKKLHNSDAFPHELSIKIIPSTKNIAPAQSRNTRPTRLLIHLPKVELLNFFAFIIFPFL